MKRDLTSNGISILIFFFLHSVAFAQENISESRRSNSINSVQEQIYLSTQPAQVAINTWDAGGYNLYVNGTAGNPSGWTTTSDMRLKKNIRPLGNVLERIKKIDGVTYEWKAEEFPEKNFEKGKQIGIIAQKVEKSFPELVTTDNEGYKALAYDRFTAVLLEAIKEQQKEIEALRKEIDAVKADRI